MRRRAAIVLVAMVALGCGAEGDVDWDVEPASAPIINGTTNFSGYANEAARTVVISGLLVCTGVVLRPNVVLTARHCVTTNQTIGGSPLQPYQMLCNGKQGTAILPAATNIDAAVVMFNGNVVNQAIDFTYIDPYPATFWVNVLGLPFMGYGKDENGNLGTLRVGTGMVTAANQNYFAVGGTGRGSFLTDATHGSATGEGDSGGPLWAGPMHYPKAVAAVVSAGSNTAGGRSIFAQAADFRDQVRTFLADNINAGYSTTFDNTSDLNKFTQVQGASGTAPRWSISGGYLVQSANAPQAMLIQKGIFENVFVSTYVESSDDDALGLIVRFVDTSNFYRCEANVQDHTLKLIKRRNNAESVLASVAWTGTFATVMQAYADENKITCKIGSTVTTGKITTSTFPIGKVGIYNHFNQGAKWSLWGAAQRAPIAGSW
jgi:hypothetical protein